MMNGAQSSWPYYSNGGKLSGGVYTDNRDHWEFIAEVMRITIESNPLHAVEFSYIGQFEAELIRMILELFHGPEDSCGLTTSGGTESNLLSILTYREWGRKRGITKPNIVCSITAHSSFDKAGFYFGVELRKVPLKKNFEIDLEGMRALIDSNTICVVASCPDFAYGFFDPVPQIA